MLEVLRTRAEALRKALSELERLYRQADGQAEIVLGLTMANAVVDTDKAASRIEKTAYALKKALTAAGQPSTRPGLFDGTNAETNGQAAPRGRRKKGHSADGDGD